jgi:hypothetical protein
MKDQGLAQSSQQVLTKKVRASLEEPDSWLPLGEQPTPAPALDSGRYGSGVRGQVFEVIVGRALAGALWRQICAGIMRANNITPEEVEAEVTRRRALAPGIIQAQEANPK